MRAPIEEKNIVTCILLSIVTCGIYGIIWFISLTDDMQKVSGDQSLPSGGMTLLLGIVTCGIYYYFWAYQIGKASRMAKMRHGMYANDSDEILYLVLQFFGLGIVIYCLVQSDLNKYAQIEMNNFNNRNNSNYYNPSF